MPHTTLRQQLLAQQQGKLKVLGLDFTHFTVSASDTIVAVATAMQTGQPLTFDLINAECSVRIERWIRELADEIGAEIVVTDDTDAPNHVVEALGCQHQVCRAHVNRNVHGLVAQLGTKALQHPSCVPCEIAELTAEQSLEDLQDLEFIIKSLPHDGQAQLDTLAARYQMAPPPSQDHRASMWYRMRLLTLGWSEHIKRLALYLSWRGDQNAKLNGTNNVTEQIIGQCAK